MAPAWACQVATYNACWQTVKQMRQERPNSRPYDYEACALPTALLPPWRTPTSFCLCSTCSDDAKLSIRVLRIKLGMTRQEQIGRPSALEASVASKQRIRGGMLAKPIRCICMLLHMHVACPSASCTNTSPSMCACSVAALWLMAWGSGPKHLWTEAALRSSYNLRSSCR